TDYRPPFIYRTDYFRGLPLVIVNTRTDSAPITTSSLPVAAATPVPAAVPAPAPIRAPLPPPARPPMSAPAAAPPPILVTLLLVWLLPLALTAVLVTRLPATDGRRMGITPGFVRRPLDFA